MFKELDDFLAAGLPFCRGRFGQSAPPDTDMLPCRALTTTDGFLAATAGYLEVHPGIDRRAALSWWTMHYFSHLAISPLILWLVYRQTLPLGACDLDLCLDRQSRLPSAFVAGDCEAGREDTTVFSAMDGAIRDHAAHLIEAAAATGLSPRVLWSNLAVYIDWIVRELGNRVDPALRAEGLALIESRTWPDGSPNPLFNLLRRECGEGEEFTRRRICCLRYIVPGVPGCGMICPLPAGRN